MSKIVQAVNVMIANPQSIGDVLRGSNGELYFTYKQYKWSIRRELAPKENYWIFFYPGEDSIETLASLSDDEWQDAEIPMVSYSSREIGTTEAQQTFAELYGTLKQRVYRLNEVLDDIIGDDFPTS